MSYTHFQQHHIRGQIWSFAIVGFKPATTIWKLENWVSTRRNLLQNRELPHSSCNKNTCELWIVIVVLIELNPIKLSHCLYPDAWLLLVFGIGGLHKLKSMLSSMSTTPSKTLITIDMEGLFVKSFCKHQAATLIISTTSAPCNCMSSLYSPILSDDAKNRQLGHLSKSRALDDLVGPAR